MRWSSLTNAGNATAVLLQGLVPLEVAAGAEGPAGAGDQHRATTVAIGLDVVEDPVEGGEHLAVDRVELARAG